MSRSPVGGRSSSGEPEGATRALGQLYDQTSRFVYGLALRILADHADAEEVTSDVYSYVWRSASTFDESRGSALAWLMVLTRSRALDRARTRALNLKRHFSIDAAAAIPSASLDVETRAWMAERTRQVRRPLEDLPEEQRELLEMAYFGGLSHAERASHSGLPLGTVKTRIRMGMIKLRERLALQEGEHQ